MFRYALAGLAALVAAGCSYGSAVDIAPFKDRTTKAIVADGDYCELDEKASPAVVKSKEDCARILFKADQRIHLMVDLDEGSEKRDGVETPDEMPFAVVPLGGGLYAAQVDVEDGKEKHQINVFVASGDAFATVPILDDEKLVKLAKKHKRLTWADMPGATPSGPGLFGARPWIKAGSVKDVKAFLKDAAREGMRLTTGDDPDDFTIGVRDTAKTADHPANAKQAKDAEAVHKIAKKLTPR